MTQAARSQEPSMEEILASIRRIIADDDAAKPKAPEPPKPAPKPVAATPAPPPPKPAPPAAPAPAPTAKNSQDDIDSLLAGFDAAPPAAAKPEPPPPPPPPPPAPPTPANDILDLTEAMETPAPSFRRIDGNDDVVFKERAPEPPPPARSTVDQARQKFEYQTEVDRTLLSPATSAAVDSAFNTLAQTVLVGNARTLDDLVREMLRPMLKAWLDDNLPNMVERMVRAEIERVSRGRG